MLPKVIVVVIVVAGLEGVIVTALTGIPTNNQINFQYVYLRLVATTWLFVNLRSLLIEI